MLRAAAERPRLVHVTTTIEVYRVAERPGPDGWAEHVRQLADLDLLIDRVTGRRIDRADLEAPDVLARYDALAQGEHAEQVPIVLTTTEVHLPLLLDEEHRVILACGAARSGKTHTGSQRFLRRVLKRGGAGRLFWIAAPQREQCWIALGKLFTGFQGQEPIVPKGRGGVEPLVRERPEGPHAKRTMVELIDGTVIDLKHLRFQTAANIKGSRVVDVLLDEAAEVKHETNWIVMLGRLVQDGGSLYGATTPNPPHFLEKTIAAAQDDASILVRSFSLHENPWLDQDEVSRYEALLSRTGGEAVVQREVYGRWVIDGEGAYWVHWDPETMAIPSNGGRIATVSPAPGAPRFTDITRAVASKLAKKNGGRNWFVRGLQATQLEYVGSMDVNKHPITCTIFKVFAAGGRVHDPDSWGMFVVDEFRLERIYSIHQFAQEFARYRGGLYKGMLVFVDPQNCHRPRDLKRGQTGQGGNVSAEALALAGFDARPAATRAVERDGRRRRIPYSPPAWEPFALVTKLQFDGCFFVDSAGCPALLKALEEQQRDPKRPREPVRVPGTASDRLASATDAVRYGAWAVFGPSRVPAPTGVLA